MNPLTTFPCSKTAYGSELPVGEVTPLGGGVNTGPGGGEGGRVKMLPLLLCKAQYADSMKTDMQ